MLDLQPGVDLEEREDFLIRLIEVLDGAGAAVSGGADKFGRHTSKLVSLLLSQYGELDSSMTFWFRRWMEQSRTPGAQTLP